MRTLILPHQVVQSTAFQFSIVMREYYLLPNSNVYKIKVFI